VRVRLLSRFRLVVKNVKPSIPNLKEVDVAGDDFRVEVEIELVVAVVRQIRRG
jgi:hypothetical protein